ncbi:MAG: hypothetical protein HYS27_23005 [Deltaproteobacteria bacterium]|nr:hypothetical protein [Deltaproteobacteria bacterium]
MNTITTADVPCSICGADHDPNDSPDIDSTHLCAACASAQRALHQPRPASPVPAVVTGDAE